MVAGYKTSRKITTLGGILLCPLITAGRFVAVSYLKNRDSTGDLYFLVDPEFAGDKDIEGALRDVVLDVAERLSYNDEWVNDDMAIFVTKKTRQALFEQAT